jgi:succinate dehydrogenase / fumarate reductase membrane anchor subunit
MQTPQLRSKMRNVKGLGAAHHGARHWWLQRITAVALIPLSAWFVISLLRAVMFPTPELVAEWLASPINSIALVLMVVALFVHACLGVQTVVEDYVKCPFKKYFLLISNYFICIGFALICILSVLRLHFIDMGSAF